MRKWQLFFCHIPKTGGTSLRRSLESLIKPSETVPDRDTLKRNGGKYPPLNDALAMVHERVDSIRFFRGHYHLSCRHFLPGGFKTVVLLRDPVERNISQFRHMIAHQGKSKDDLMERLYAGKPIGPDNTMTRFLGGSVMRDPKRSSSNVYSVRRPIDDPELELQQAITELAVCDFVGFTSDLPTLKDQLSEFAGTSLTIRVDNDSKGPAPVFTQQEIALFERHNQLDRRLYEYAIQQKGLSLKS